MSGILQQGYSFGYVTAACANLGVGGATDTWKTVFWIAGKPLTAPGYKGPLLMTCSWNLNWGGYRPYFLP